MTNLNPDKYAIYHLGVSGGKDSTAALLWLIYESGLDPNKFCVTFNDTKHEDALTYAYLKYLSSKVFPIETIEPELGFFELAKKKKRFPSTKARFCTQMLKIVPCRAFVLELMREHGEVLLMNGVRKEEGHIGNNRGQVPQFGFDEGFCCDIFRPILHWTLEDVWEIHKRYLDIEDVCDLVADDPGLSDEHKEEILQELLGSGVPCNPLYAMGASRVGCYPCIHSRKMEIRAMARYRPARIEEIAHWESQVGSERGISTFFRRNTVPERHRSKKILTKDGEEMYVPTIHDVVRWSQTSYGGKQFEFDFGPTASACDLGDMCE